MGNLIIIKYANHAVRFILEIISLMAIGYFCFQLQKGSIIKYSAGIGSVLLIIVIWGNFGSPSAPYKLQGISRLALELIIYSFTFVAISFTINMKWALLYAGLVTINTVLLYIWD